ncbi:hypothetical protein JR316_0010583 [Psilocybe cubensis]|uniref:Uncharacterized protein n=2 Tax=Psilocybe cubensis TaxID=181762 RepID=A0ACB8GMG9_PSICU|nr:hypothetical protein JR316_0010583 [Psilocybe cubensis]KAH9476669.1 hypothetical protein JR316_0010583 [Psilocybe cubensis]
MPTLRNRKAVPSAVEHSASAVKSTRDATKRSRTMDSNVDDDGEESPPKKKKRKVPKKSVAKAKTVENSLGGLPVEIWAFEICTDLEPKDLWHLSCTSKHFRRILKSSDLAPTLWKASRALIGMPDCPSDLTDIQYTNLAFGESCQYCQKFVMVEGPGQVSMDPRVQKKCPKILVPYLPSVLLSYTNYVATGETWKRECAAAENQAKWMKEKIEELKYIEEHSTIYKDWDAKQRHNNLFRRRLARVIAQIKSLGWTSELSKMSRENYQNFLKSPRIVDACKNNSMTDTMLNDMGAFINTSMTQYRTLRLCADRKALLGNRLPILSEVTKECAARYPVDTPTPSAAELLKVQLVRDLIDDTSLEPFTSAHLDPLRLNYAEISLDWRTRTEGKLVSMIKSACGTEYKFDESSVLRLATTIFSCTKCKDSHSVTKDNFWYPQVLAHYHSIPFDQNRRAEEDLVELERRSLEIRTGSTFWNDDNDIFFNKDYMQAMADILEHFGFDPAVTTSEEMDAADPIFECVFCNCSHRGRYVLRWNMLARHQWGHKRHFRTGKMPLTYELLSGNDEIAAKRKIGSSTMIAEHAWQEHGIAELADSDMLPSPAAKTINHSRMWPPQKINYAVSRWAPTV